MEYLKHNWKQFIKHLISAPFIYWAFIGFAVFDIFLEIYHRICFPLYGLEIVDRKKYIKFDRHRLSYLDPIQKFNCLYCSYWNWLLAYATEVVARTEKYWCWIASERDPNFIPPKHHESFLEYWDEKAFFETYHSWEDRKKCKLEW